MTVASGAAGLLVYLPPLVHLRLNRPFPAGAFASAVNAAPGCVTADNSTALIVTNALSRNLQRGCRTVVDLSGYSHDVRAATGTKGSRVGNRAWQRFVLAYFRSGSAAFVITFDDGTHFNANTVATLDQWPVLAKRGQYVLAPHSPDIFGPDIFRA